MQSEKKILVIEDDKPIRQMLISVLSIEGYTVIASSNGKEAIDAIQGGNRPDVILLDMMMPIMNGWDFLDFIRANATTAKIPIVVVSAYSEIAKSVKPDAVVAKPIQLKALLAAVEEFAA